MGARMRAHDWTSTPLGEPQNWPRSLKTAVRIMLTSRQPIWIGWGRELIYLYNDAYKSIIGGKHPWALGRPTAEVWREIWTDIGPMLATAMGGDEGTYVEEQLLIMERSGYPEETYYTFSYSPVPDDDGMVGGIICANTDDTRRVIGDRQLALLRELAATTAETRSLPEACRRSSLALATDTRDVPFALIYLVEPDGREIALVGRCGIDADHPAALSQLPMEGPSLWPLAEVIREQKPQVVSHLAARFGAECPRGAWDVPPRQAAVIPIPARGETARKGVLVTGLNPFRLFDDDYRNFLELAAGEIGASLANAQAYEEERRRAEALAEIDRAKTTFFSNISHEFRTPLTLMLGPIEDALNDTSLTSLPEVQRERLDIAHRNSLRLLRLVNSLLDFSRIEAGRVRASFVPTDLAAFTAELASNFRSATDRAGLRLTIACPALPHDVHVDREMWEKIVLNLLSNAFKFTFEGEIAVEMGTSADGKSAELRVRDTGTGIPPDELPHLFERFHRIEGAKGRTFEGSGIGLALVHELIKQHGGAITVASEFGRGSVFTVTIPFGSAHLPAERVAGRLATTLTTGSGVEAYVQEALRWLPQDEGATDLRSDLTLEGTSETPDASTRGSGERIILADDNTDLRNYVKRLLEAQGYRVEAFADGQGALDAARHHRPDLILSDVMMPRLDGIGLLSALRSDDNLRGSPVILLSARAGEEARVEGLEAGADDYVNKPFSARELLARVRANLQLARIRRDAEEIQRRQAARLEAVVSTVPTAVWFTHDREAKRVFGNAYGARLLRVRPDSNMSLSAPEDERPVFRVLRDRVQVEPSELPLQRAARGEEVAGEELELSFEDGSSATAIFQASPIVDAAGVFQGAVCAAIDITERKRQERHRELLVNELNHRVKNTLTTVQSFALQTLRNASSLADGRRAFDARLIALSKAHDVLVRENWEAAELREVVTEALAAHAEPESARLNFGGPDLRMRPSAALAISMALHELATNAVKHGALSNSSGTVDLAWKVDDRFELCWTELGGPPVVPPSRRGFGTRLIQQGLPHEFGGADVDLRFAPEGVVCVIRASLQEIRASLGGFDISTTAAGRPS
ncbi:ATP-binding protein [Bradyrhizobium sp. MOS003]|uniref:ATP-binding protein n=1 Tax=Bradyrhizobium sp. MOS003 TaxID=2133946 RepID=UPI000D12618E|nr:ATP-binding protein [Bradyrhizobium sp. MOS003]PSO14475.1 two-component system sensor histidine kinase/response regulator [Bradyrhizobium sp. MOS003]